MLLECQLEHIPKEGFILLAPSAYICCWLTIIGETGFEGFEAKEAQDRAR